MATSRLATTAAVVMLGLLAGGWQAPGSAAAVPEEPVTEAPSAVTSTTATFNGELNPHGATEKASYHFAYSTGPECTEGGLTAPATGPFPEAEGAQQAVSVPVTSLQVATAYTVCLIAANPAEETESIQGTLMTFTTPAQALTPPAFAGVSVSSITQTSAVINATLQPQGLPTRYELQLGPTQGLLQPQASGDTTTTTPLALAIASLTPATTYYYTLTATNPDGTSPTEEGAFTTETSPAPTNPLTQPPTPPLLTTPTTTFPPPPPPTTPLTNAQKLAKALKACKKQPKNKRAKCQKQAHKKYPTKTTKKHH